MCPFGSSALFLFADLFCLNEVRCTPWIIRRGLNGGPPVKAGIAMFFKVIALLLTAVLGYFVVQNDFDLYQAYFFLLLPASAILSYLILGAAD